MVLYTILYYYLIKESDNERNDNQEIRTLQQKNQDLRNEICMMKDRLKEQNNALKIISEERDSYRTALQIMTKEFNAHKEKDPSSTSVISDPVANQDGWSTQQNARRSRRNSPTLMNTNQFSTSSSTSKSTGNREDIQEPQTIRQKEIIIAGDSILKNLQGQKLSKESRVKISSFPGCTTLDMKDYVKPLLRRNPAEIILHVGTNSLRSCNSARAYAEEIVDLASMVGTESSAKITISSLVGRTDDESLASKIPDVNKIIKKFCNQNNWGFVDHKNISVNNHLNRSSLHLNRSGTSRLARNFINHLNLE